MGEELTNPTTDGGGELGDGQGQAAAAAAAAAVGPTVEELLEKERNDRKADLGRLDKTNTVVNTARQQLRNAGFDLDPESGAIIPMGQGYAPAGGGFGQQTHAQPQAGVQQADADAADLGDLPDDFWDNPRPYVASQVQAGVKKAMQEIVPAFMEMLNPLQQSVLSQQHDDFAEIAPEVNKGLNDLGFRNLAHAQAVNPKAVQLAIDAARGRRAASGGAAPAAGPTAAEAARAAALAAAGGLGGAAGGASTGALDLDAQEREDMLRFGLTEGDLAGLDGPVRLTRKAAK